ncbi:MerR family transcriptional regulator [Marinococcus halophilus]|uniref:HTH-type transcriptional regulator GlnR n=1 Tax=Marinococcus halophilus TaxID=1371 RepID=A0A510Y4Q0_MARHA|nr:MerR family transcriptional regulator [Marinococcus halophilus]OZT80261.1 MerR family transcriptional regulator [Marinococcus halophilus]GEK58319.1 HTH-type transcriptional regulator GlnR [Marinococcus halophilus]
MNDHVRRNTPLFPIGIVQKLTELTPRQIRYYEEHGLVFPTRTEGNQRLFSFRDVDRLLEIKAMMERGVNLSGIKEIYELKTYSEEPKQPKAPRSHDMTDRELRKHLRKEVMMAGKYSRPSMIQGQLSRFFD